jgi:hypothetical protein
MENTVKDLYFSAEEQQEVICKDALSRVALASHFTDEKSRTERITG